MTRGGARPGAGRKECSEEEKRKLHAFKCSDDEWKNIKAKAKEHGFRSVSEYIRKSALREIK